MKIIWILLLASIACRLLAGRWPWQMLKSFGSADAEARARSLLGVSQQAAREDIIDAHRRLITVVHPDRGGTNDAVHQADAARDLLLARLPRDSQPR